MLSSLGCLGLVAANVALHLARRSDRAQPSGLRRLPTGGLAFSGVALEEGRWWVWLTASFGHDGWPHLLNNMAMLCGSGPELERRVGSLSLVLLYLGCGAVRRRAGHWGTGGAQAGWALTYANNRYRAGDPAALGVSRWVCGLAAPQRVQAATVGDDG